MGPGRIVLWVVLTAGGLAAMGRPAGAADDPAAEALQALARGDTATALLKSEAALQKRPETAYVWNVRAYALSAAGRKDEALTAYAKASTIDPRDPLSRANRGAVLLALGKPEEALVALDEAVRVAPGYARAHNHRGVALERLGRLDESRAAFRRAIALDSRDAVAHNNLGALALKRGVEGAAAAHFAQALEIDPKFDAPAVNAALVLVASGDSAKAEAQILAAAERPGASAAVRARGKSVLGSRAARERRWADARTLYLDLVELDPDDPSALNNLGVAEDQLGMAREALLHFQTSLMRHPADPYVMNNVGVVHMHRGDLVQAEESFKEVLIVDARFHRAHHNLGVVLGAKGDRAGALQAFRRAAELAPQDASSVYNLALLDRDAGRLDAALERAAYERALAMDPNLTEAWLALGTLLADPTTAAAVRDPARARQALERFLSLAYPDDVAGRRQAEDWLAWLDANSAKTKAPSGVEAPKAPSSAEGPQPVPAPKPATGSEPKAASGSERP